MNWAMLSIVEEAGVAVLTLTEGVEQDEFLRSRLTRSEARRQVLDIARTLDRFDSDVRMILQEIDWAGWETIARRLHEAQLEDDALWFAVRSLVPATMMWLRYYRERQPEVFSFRL